MKRILTIIAVVVIIASAWWFLSTPVQAPTNTPIPTVSSSAGPIPENTKPK